MVEGDDPRSIRSIAVTAGDVVMALEANRRGGDDGRTVLRVTPPFSGRMRARIHVESGDGSESVDDPGPIPIPPADLVADPPPYPHPDDTEDAIRADPDAEYTPDLHHDRHVDAVEAWRETVRDAIVDEVTLSIGGDDHRIDVTVLD